MGPFLQSKRLACQCCDEFDEHGAGVELHARVDGPWGHLEFLLDAQSTFDVVVPWVRGNSRLGVTGVGTSELEG